MSIVKPSVFILDVDGVLTAGRIIMDDDGREIKHFDVRDGHGIKILMRFDIDVVLLTGRKSSVVEHRARDLGIREVHQQIWDKVAAFEGILERRGLTADQVAFMGDDVVDIPLQRRVGFSAARRMPTRWSGVPWTSWRAGPEAGAPCGKSASGSSAGGGSGTRWPAVMNSHNISITGDILFRLYRACPGCYKISHESPPHSRLRSASQPTA